MGTLTYTNYWITLLSMHVKKNNTQMKKGWYIILFWYVMFNWIICKEYTFLVKSASGKAVQIEIFIKIINKIQ